MLVSSGVATRLPAQNLEWARTFYAEKLGLQPHQLRIGGQRPRQRQPLPLAAADRRTVGTCRAVPAQRQ